MDMIEALTRLHKDMPRQGPGDDGFSRAILARLPDLARRNRIADLGCGTGVAGLLLAQELGHKVLCVDSAPAFVEALNERARDAGLADQIIGLCADMGALDPARYQFDLIWSEGAAYNLGFENALRAWRPLMAEGGIAVVSEMSWFSDAPPAEATRYWQAAYPQMGSAAQNIARAKAQGFDLLFSERLPAIAWWQNYYTPLTGQLARFDSEPAPAMQDAIAETRQEIALFERYSDHFGYVFYVLQAA
ncbi:MAG: class I SAM-dependent methyltransferase [Mangrovicoccus sp.]|nr:class I SAM-dependent methyltransferase [Mangrovicoccus sp.]